MSGLSSLGHVKPLYARWGHVIQVMPS